jgi:hypothetical protein
MTDPNFSRQISKIAKNLVGQDKRLSILERTAQAKFVSITDGTTTYYNTDGEPVVQVGKQADGTYTTVDVNGAPLPIPSDPVVSSTPGSLTITWDGYTDTGSAIWPATFSHVEVHVSDTPGYAPVNETELQTFHGAKGGTLTVDVDPDEYFIKLVAVNTSGVESGASSEVSQVVEEVPPPGILTYFQNDAPTGLDLDDFGSIWYDTDDGNKQYFWDGIDWVEVTNAALQAVEVKAEEALQTATSRVQVLYQPEEPAGLTGADRVIWYDSDNGYAASYWDGSSWSPYTIGAGALADGAVTTQKLATPVSQAIADAQQKANETATATSDLALTVMRATSSRHYIY